MSSVGRCNPRHTSETVECVTYTLKTRTYTSCRYDLSFHLPALQLGTTTNYSYTYVKYTRSMEYGETAGNGWT